MKYGMKWIAVLFIVFMLAAPLLAQEVIVIGSNEEVISLFEKDSWWVQKKRGEQVKVPYRMIVAVADRWQKFAPELPVSTKKDIFFSALTPLVVNANKMVLDRRSLLEKADERLAKGGSLSEEDAENLRKLAIVLRITIQKKAVKMTSSDEYRKIIKEALYRLDEIPAGLVLGQAAYESGYGTSRFTSQGNALFGQWTFGGEGLVPEQQRKSLGDHRISSFKWPFDSVRAYFLNLSSHPAYEEFRKIRANLRASGKPLSSLALADGLKNYSERGQVYVDTLKGIIKVNNLDIADNAAFMDEPMSFIFAAKDKAEAAAVRKEIKAMRKSGEINKVIERMRLE
jgi:Bax protein